MTRKDYEKLAAVMLKARPESPHAYPLTEEWTQWVYTLRLMGQALAKGNPRFDYEKFMLSSGRQKVGA